MLHLAQVQKKGFLGKTEFRLLARQKSEHIWAILSEEETILSADNNAFNEGLLVLVELSNTRQILSIQPATEWVLDFVQKYLTSGLTPSFLQQEAERAEQWRQSLTLQSQELGRRALEMEARREQIQDLEEKLKRDKQQLELMAAQLKNEADSAS